MALLPMIVVLFILKLYSQAVRAGRDRVVAASIWVVSGGECGASVGARVFS